MTFGSPVPAELFARHFWAFVVRPIKLTIGQQQKAKTPGAHHIADGVRGVV
jgi:hypothetical protein